jgi:hypothetical protein
MKGNIFVLGISILFLIVVTTAVSPSSTIAKTPANVTLYAGNSNYSHPNTPLQFSPDISLYLHWKLSGR